MLKTLGDILLLLTDEVQIKDDCMKIKLEADYLLIQPAIGCIQLSFTTTAEDLK